MGALPVQSELYGPGSFGGPLPGSYRPEGTARVGCLPARWISARLLRSALPLPHQTGKCIRGKKMTKFVLGETNQVRNGFLLLSGTKKASVVRPWGHLH